MSYVPLEIKINDISNLPAKSHGLPPKFLKILQSSASTQNAILVNFLKIGNTEFYLLVTPSTFQSSL